MFNTTFVSHMAMICNNSEYCCRFVKYLCDEFVILDFSLNIFKIKYQTTYHSIVRYPLAQQ